MISESVNCLQHDLVCLSDRQTVVSNVMADKQTGGLDVSQSCQLVTETKMPHCMLS